MAISMPQCHGGADQGNIRASIGSMSTFVIFYFSIVGREHPRFAHNHSEILRKTEFNHNVLLNC